MLGKRKDGLDDTPSLVEIIDSNLADIQNAAAAGDHAAVDRTTTVWCGSWTRLRWLEQPTPTRPEARSSSLTRHGGEQPLPDTS